MFNEYMNELHKGKTFYSPIGLIGLYEKKTLFTFTLNGNFLPFKTVSFENNLYSTIDLNISDDIIENLQNFINENLNYLIFNEVSSRINHLSKYLKTSLINEAYEFVKLTKALDILEYNKENLIDILSIISDIDSYQDNFYEFFNIIAKDSSTPLADFLDPLIKILKIKLEKNGIEGSSFFDIFWEFKEASKENKTYVLEFSFEDVNYSFNILNIEEFVEVATKYFI